MCFDDAVDSQTFKKLASRRGNEKKQEVKGDAFKVFVLKVRTVPVISIYVDAHVLGEEGWGGCRRTLNVVPQSLSFLVFETRCLTDLKLAKWVGLTSVSRRDLLASTFPAGMVGGPPCPLCKCGFLEDSVQSKQFTN